MISYQKCHPVVHVYMSLMYFLVYFQQCITKIIFKLFIFHCTFSRMQHAVFSVTVLEGPANLLLYDGRNIDVDLMFKVTKSVLCFGHLVHSFFGNKYCDFFLIEQGRSLGYRHFPWKISSWKILYWPPAQFTFH